MINGNENSNNFNAIPKANLDALISKAKANKNKGEKSNKPISAPKAKPSIPEGKYQAIITDFKSEPKYYDEREALMLTVIFEVIINEEKTSILRQPYWHNTNTDSIFYKHFEEILCRDPRDDFYENEIIGCFCEIYIVHNTNEKGTFANVDELKRIDIYENDINQIEI